jgi:ADP-ribosylglycohydrolase
MMRGTESGSGVVVGGDCMPGLGDRERLYDHILGSLAAAALGDAMGAATEQHEISEIIGLYGGLLRELRAPSSETFSSGNLPGQITDDTSQMFALCEALIESNGDLTEDVWVQKLLHWSQTSPMARMMGPTTRPLLEAIAAGQDTATIGTSGFSTRKLTSFGTTNGAAMRIAPAGLMFPSDMESAVRLAWVTSRPTHDTQIAAAGAGAIAAGVSQALDVDADVYSVARACLWGARFGEELGAREGRRVSGPNVARRIEIAIDEALRARDLEDALRRIEASVGNSVMTVESVPAAVGIFVAAAGDPLETVVGGTNIGNDSDTVAAMAGSLAGALRGVAAVPEDLFATVKSVNSEDIEGLAARLTELAWRRVGTNQVSVSGSRFSFTSAVDTSRGH